MHHILDNCSWSSAAWLAWWPTICATSSCFRRMTGLPAAMSAQVTFSTITGKSNSWAWTVDRTLRRRWFHTAWSTFRASFTMQGLRDLLTLTLLWEAPIEDFFLPVADVWSCDHHHAFSLNAAVITSVIASVRCILRHSIVITSWRVQCVVCVALWIGAASSSTGWTSS